MLIFSAAAQGAVKAESFEDFSIHIKKLSNISEENRMETLTTMKGIKTIDTDLQVIAIAAASTASGNRHTFKQSFLILRVMKKDSKAASVLREMTDLSINENGITNSDLDLGANFTHLNVLQRFAQSVKTGPSSSMEKTRADEPSTKAGPTSEELTSRPPALFGTSPTSKEHPDMSSKVENGNLLPDENSHGAK